jgi:hypothetical protein
MILPRYGRSLAVTVGALAFLSVGTFAWGHAFGGMGRGQGGFGPPRDLGGVRGLRSGGLLQRLIFPCRGECFDAGRSCIGAAESDLTACATEACDAEIPVARAACSADLATEECRDARTALLECAEPCLTTGQSAVASCRSTLEDCLDACETTEEE